MFDISNIISQENIEKYRVWVTSDTHFLHNNIVKYCQRPGWGIFDVHNFDRHNDLIVQMWHEMVRKDDVVIHLGDVAMRAQGVRERAKDLPGRVFVVPGNHDERDVLEACEEIGWTLIEPFTMKTEAYGIGNFTHYDLETIAPGAWNCHGHTHNNSYAQTPRHINVGVEVRGYAPVAMKVICEKGAHAIRPHTGSGMKGRERAFRDSERQAIARNVFDIK